MNQSIYIKSKFVSTIIYLAPGETETRASEVLSYKYINPVTVFNLNHQNYFNQVHVTCRKVLKSEHEAAK